MAFDKGDVFTLLRLDKKRVAAFLPIAEMAVNGIAQETHHAIPTRRPRRQQRHHVQ